MKVLSIVTAGTSDPTKASLPFHLAANGAIEIGDEPIILLAGDATEYVVGDAVDKAEGVGIPPLRDLVAKLRDHEVPVYV